jgi:hypothetical protein
MNSTNQYLSEDQIAKIAQDPKNIVYKYEHDQATTVYTAEQQTHYVNTIRHAYLQKRQQDSTWIDGKIRTAIRNEHKELHEFIKNNERIWLKLTDRATPDQEIKHIYFMIYVRLQMERGLPKHQADALVQEYLVKNFNTGLSPQQYNEKMKGQESKKH